MPGGINILEVKTNNQDLGSRTENEIKEWLKKEFFYLPEEEI